MDGDEEVDHPGEQREREEAAATTTSVVDLGSWGEKKQLQQQRPVSPDIPAGETRAEKQEELSRLGREEERCGFLDRNGKRRKYDAAPPPTDVNWELLIPHVHEWPEDVDRGDQYALLSASDKNAMLKDDADNEQVSATVREAGELLCSGAISSEDDGRPSKWDGFEGELRKRNIKLSEATTFQETTEDGSIKRYGIRIFHIIFRFYVIVLFSGRFDEGDDAGWAGDDDDRDMRMIGYYFAAMTTEQAIAERCV